MPPPPAIPCPNPRARAAALDRHAAPPREVGPALFGRGFAPAPAVSLSSSARPYVPTPLSKAASAHLSPPPTTDPKPPLGPSGLGFPVRRWVRYHTAVTPFPHLLLPGTPASGGAAPDPPGHSERVHTAAAPPAAGVEAAVGAAGTVAALAAQTPDVTGEGSSFTSSTSSSLQPFLQSRRSEAIRLSQRSWARAYLLVAAAPSK